MIGQTITLRVVTGGGYDEYGDPIPPTIVDTVVKAMVAPRESTEPTATGRNGVVVGLTAYLPRSAPDITHVDSVLVDGVAYLVEGEPGRWHSPTTGALTGTQVALKRATG